MHYQELEIDYNELYKDQLENLNNLDLLILI